MSELSAIARLDAVDQAELCRRGEVSAAELFDACMRRIERLNPLLRAVVTIAPQRARSVAAGPFAGVPFLVKDAVPWPGLRWSLGSRLLARRIADLHTPYGRLLADAGLQCAGKSAMSEFGLLASTESLLEGATHNPWDLALSAAGSSGGSAVAVAAGLVPIAHASDGGASIRVPASVCGVFGFKPSRGRTVAANVSSSDLAEITSDHCISRSVRDSALFLSVTEDPSASTPVGFVRDPIDRSLRIGTWSRTMTGAEPEPAVRVALDATVKLLGDLGHRVHAMTAPEFDGTALADALFVAAGAAVAPLIERTDATRDVPVQRDELEPFTWQIVDDVARRGAAALPRARDTFALAVRAYREATRGCDVVLTPTIATEPWPIGTLSPVLGREELMRRLGRIVGYTPIQNVAGCPAMSVPLHSSDRGLPVGIHFAAAPGADALLLGLAYQLERARPWKDRWPPYSIVALASAGEVR